MMETAVVFFVIFNIYYQPEHCECVKPSGQTTGRGQVLYASELRRLVNRYIFQRTDAPDTLGNFLLNGVTKLPNPLDDYKKIKPSNMREIVQMAKKYSTRFKTDEILDLDIWEQKLNFNSRTPDNMSWFLDDAKEKELIDTIKKTYSKNNTTEKQILDPLRKQKEIQKKHSPRKRNNETRRMLYNRYYEHYTSLHYYTNNDINKMMIDYMMQSIFQSRYNLRKTLEIRKRYRMDASYRIAIMHTMIVEYLEKIKKLYATAIKFYRSESIKFIYFLICYEKVLQAQTDITTTVRRIFDEHYNFIQKKREKAGFVNKTSVDLETVELSEFNVKKRHEKQATTTESASFESASG